LTRLEALALFDEELDDPAGDLDRTDLDLVRGDDVPLRLQRDPADRGLWGRRRGGAGGGRGGRQRRRPGRRGRLTVDPNGEAHRAGRQQDRKEPREPVE